MKIIFLDIDGVLNSYYFLKIESTRFGRPLSAENFPFDPSCMNCLCYIIKETDAKIIITSSWRKYPDHVAKFIEVFKEYHLEQHIIGFTPITDNREEEINLTLQQFNEEINFIILNDYMTSLKFNEHLIQTDNQYGLTYEEAIEVISKLNNTRQL